MSYKVVIGLGAAVALYVLVVSPINYQLGNLRSGQQLMMSKVEGQATGGQIEASRLWGIVEASAYVPAKPTRMHVDHSRLGMPPESVMTFGGEASAAQKEACRAPIHAFNKCMKQRVKMNNDQYLNFHARRYKINFASLCRRLPWEWTAEGAAAAPRRVVELGAGSVFTSCFAEVAGPSVKFDVWGDYKHDLREPFSGLTSATYDLVICQEVIEHIADPNTQALQGDDDAASFKAKGIMSLLRESRRVLKPRSMIMVTTPNVASHQQLLYVLAGIHPFSNPHHVREMSRGDATKYLEDAGFEDVKAEFVNTWRPTGPQPSEALLEQQMQALARSLADLLANQPLETIGVDMGRVPAKLDLARVPRHDNAFYYATSKP
jgi:hypothetical protein